MAQLTGTKTIPGNYPNIASAISALNSSGVGGGGVTFNIAYGFTETFSTPLAGVITASGTSANPVVFQKAGSGANPLVTAAPGTGTLDGIIVLSGTDYITFDGLDLVENAANTTNTLRMEWGFALLKASSTAPFNGCQHVTIKNCHVALDKVNYVSVGIYAGNHTRSSGTSLAITTTSDAMSNCKFYGNGISNVYKGISLNGYDDAAPFTLLDQNNEIGKDGANTITNFGGSSDEISVIQAVNQDKLIIANNIINGGGSYTMLIGINVKKGQNTFSDIYNNHITLTANNYAYAISDSLPSGYTYGTVNIHNNTISDCHTTAGSEGDFIAIVQAGGNKVNVYGNTISNNTHHSGSWYGNNFHGINCYYNADSLDIYSNQISNNTLTGGGIMASIVFSCSYVSVHDNIIHHDSITDPYGGGFSHAYQYGIISASIDGNMNCFGNQIHDLYVDNTYAGYEGYVAGIFDNSYCYGLKSIYSNSIYNITSSYNETVPISTYGMRLNNNRYLEVYNNNISNISNGAKTGSSSGLYINNTSFYAYIYNNSISGIYTPYATGTNALAGIRLDDAWSHPVFRLYNNSVYLDGSSLSVGNFGSSGLFAYSNIDLEMKNNILVNLSTPVGTGKTVAYRRSDPTLTYYSYWSSYNDFFAGTPGPSHLIFTDGTNSFQTIADYITYMSSTGGFGVREIQSISENPPFVNVSVMPYDIHINAAIPTLCESGGDIISFPVVISSDIDNQPRYPYPGYPDNPSYPATAPDIGSDEFAGITLDLIPPTIYYDGIANTSSLDPQTMTAFISDESGIPTSVTGLPMLYWRINSGTWNSCQGVHLSYDEYSFTFGSGVVAGDVVSYYVVAQDNAFPTPNLAAMPSSGASGFTTNPPACSTLPDFFNSYIILSTVCGTYTVGIGGDFPSLTGHGGLFDAINSSVLTCDLVANITSDLSEDGIFALNQWLEADPGNYSLTIQPVDNSLKTISGSTVTGLIRFDGARRVIIDGGVSKNLLFRNSADPGIAGAGATISYQSGCEDNTLKNCIIEGNPVGSYDGIINIYGFYSYNLTISDNEIRNSTSGFEGPPANCVYAWVSYADSLKILNNNIVNWSSNGIYFESVNGNSRIANNSFYYNLPDPSLSQQAAIHISGSSHPAIHGNYIGGQSPMCEGPKFQHAGFSSFTGIYLDFNSGTTIGKAGGPSPATVDNNVVQNISINNDPVYGFEFFTGIRLRDGQAEIGTQAGNLIGSLTTANSITINGTGESFGIYSTGTFNQSNIENNIISNITLTATDGPTHFTGLYTNAGKVNRNKICNIGVENAGLFPTITGIYDQCSFRFSNMFSNNSISLDGGAALNPVLYGIHAIGQNISEFYYNSVSITGPATETSSTYSFYNDSYNDLYSNNNVFSNSRPAGGTGKHYSISSPNLPASWYSDHNDLYSSALPLAYWNGTDLDDLAGWVAATGGDANSVSVNPSFASASDLHTYEPALDNSGIFIPGIDVDLDGNPINDPPDMGCYQFTSGPVKNLNLTLFLEGLYIQPGVMNAAIDGSTGLPKWGYSVADKVTIQLHEGTSPYAPVGSPVEMNLSINGIVHATIPDSYGSDYFISVSHRNSIETWSATPVSFTPSTISYNFSDLASKAFDSNMKDMGGVFVFYAGDANSDGVVDAFDLAEIETAADGFVMGYIADDVNGDGTVDALDLIMADNNAAGFVMVKKP